MEDRPIPYRIRIGVTGHRKDLPERALLEAMVRRSIGAEEWLRDRSVAADSVFSLFDDAALRSMRAARNTPVRFSVYTGLAEGADRIVARQLFDIPGTWIHAVLPFNPGAYENTFEEIGAIGEFRELLARDPSPTIISKDPTNDDERRAAYLAAGKAVVDASDLLIAIWNGKPAAGKGGTADVIDHAIKSKRPVICIRTDGEPRLEVSAFNGLRIPGLVEQDRFNGEPAPEEYVKGAKEDHFGAFVDVLPLAPHGAIAIMEKSIWPFYVRASGISKRCKRIHLRIGLSVYILSGLAVLSIMVGVFIESLHVAAFVAEAALLAGIFAVITYAHRRRIHQRWLEHRYLAERCRAAIYLFVFGLRPFINNPLGRLKKKIEDEWVVRVFDELLCDMERQRLTKAVRSDADWLHLVKRMVSDQLVKGQIRYHGKAAAKSERRNSLLERSGQLAFFLAFAVAIAHVALGSLDEQARMKWLGDMLTVLAVMLPVTAAAFEGLRRQREYGRIARVSERMVAELEQLDAELLAAVDPEELQNVLQRIDHGLTRESAEWLGLMVDTDVELTA